MAKHAVNGALTDDEWAYTPEMVERLRRARTQRAYVLGSEDLERIAREAEAAHAEGRDYQVSEDDLEAMEAQHLAARARQASSS